MHFAQDTQLVLIQTMLDDIIEYLFKALFDALDKLILEYIFETLVLFMSNPFFVDNETLA